MKKLISLLFLGFSLLILAQEKPAFWADIQQFKTINAQSPPPKNAILLVGSSSFTKWTDVADYFPDKTIINRGFGGSRLLDLNFYSKELLQGYDPKQIIIYCGENDFADNTSLKPKTVLNRFKNFYAEIRKYYPNINVSYISMKRSPSRENLWPQMKTGNALIKKFLSKQKNTSYIDITKAMENASGQVQNDLFLEDQLHMKPEGYVIWTKVMTPFLVE